MVAEIRVPKLGMTRSDVTVVAITKESGDRVEEGEKVAVIETAKVSYEIEAPVSGLVFYLKRVKEKVGIGDLLAVVAESKEAFAEFKGGLPSREQAEVGPGEEPLWEEEGEEEWGVRISFEEKGEKRPSFSNPPTPRIDLRGRKILKRIPFLGMRRTIADNLVLSLQTGAQLTIVSETDMTELTDYRKELLLDYPEARITYVDMLVKILASVLKEFPILNSSVVQDEIVCWDEYHIGVAVALEEGLVVPVVREADKKSLVAVSREIKSLSRKARQNELDPSAYEGGTFTLSSGGKVETDIMTPIINPPQNAILGFGKVGPRPAVYRGELAIRTTAFLCLTHDHRVIDGVPASLFLGRVKEIVESRELFLRILR